MAQQGPPPRRPGRHSAPAPEAGQYGADPLGADAGERGSRPPSADPYAADPYAADLFQSLSAQSRETVGMAFAGPFDSDRQAIYGTLNAVLDESLRTWVMNRATIADVYANIDNAIRLIYQYGPA